MEISVFFDGALATINMPYHSYPKPTEKTQNNKQLFEKHAL